MKLLNQKDLTELLRCSRTTLVKMRKDPLFPSPVTGRLMWVDRDIERYIERSKA